MIYIYQIIVKLLIDFIILDTQKYIIDIKQIDFAERIFHFDLFNFKFFTYIYTSEW